MVAAIATEDPEIAAKAPEVTMVATPRPPRWCPTQAPAARNSSREMPPAEASTPISTNIGIIDSAWSVAVRSGDIDNIRNAGSSPLTAAKPSTPTEPIAMASGTRSTIIVIRARKPSSATKELSIGISLNGQSAVAPGVWVATRRSATRTNRATDITATARLPIQIAT